MRFMENDFEKLDIKVFTENRSVYDASNHSSATDN